MSIWLLVRVGILYLKLLEILYKLLFYSALQIDYSLKIELENIQIKISIAINWTNRIKSHSLEVQKIYIPN